MPESVTLEAKTRNERGKIVAGLRRRGQLPAVLYGRGIESVPISVAEADFKKVFMKAGENTLIRLVIKSEDDKSDVRNVLIQDVSTDSLTGKPLHIDFYQVRMDEAVKVSVPLEFLGDSPAVKNSGGILVKALQELEIETLPGYIPERIAVDISNLVTFDDTIYVKDLAVPANVKILVDGETAVVSVQPPRSEDELRALEEKPVESVGEVVVETEEKKAERAAAETEKSAQEASS